MGPRLTVALPTYNRADLLQRQLNWFSGAVSGHEDEVEILLSDNCSTDATADVINRFRSTFKGSSLVVHRHRENVGAVRNIVYCMQAAVAPHVWVLSDDDLIEDRAFTFVLRALDVDPDLALLVLNFENRDVRSGRLVFKRCFPVDEDSVWPTGRIFFEQCMRARKGTYWGGLALTTAMVYRTDLVQAAIASWPDGVRNEVFQLYLGAYCARRGPTHATANSYVTCISGDHHFMQDPLTYLKLRSADACETFAYMARDGYSPRLMLWKVVERPAAFLPSLPICLMQSPKFVLTLLRRYFQALVAVTRTALSSAFDRPA